MQKKLLPRRFKRAKKIKKEAYLYNPDSSLFVIKHEKIDADGLPAKFSVIQPSNLDTLYTSSGQYAFVKWVSETSFQLQKGSRLPDIHSNQKIGDYTSGSEYFLYDIIKQELIPFTPESNIK
jgi:hypothetical protein